MTHFAKHAIKIKMGAEPKMKRKNFLYDVHCHAFLLHHPGFLGVINRFLMRGSVRVRDLVDRRYGRIVRRFLFPAEKPYRIFLYSGFGLLGLFIVSAIVSLFTAAADAWGPDVFSSSLLLKSAALTLYVFAAVGLILGVVFFVFLIRRSRTDEPSTLFRSIFNLLSLIENDIERQFLYLELDVLRLDPEQERRFVRPYLRLFEKRSQAGRPEDGRTPPEEDNPADLGIELKKLGALWGDFSSGFLFGGERYDKLVITPLIMDFGYREFDEFAGIIHYDTPPAKPVVRQMTDLYNGISAYKSASLFHILDIRPFLGLNTRNYPLGVRLPVRSDLVIPVELEFVCVFVREAASQPEPQRALILIRNLNEEERTRLLQANTAHPEIGRVRKRLEHLCETAFERKQTSFSFPAFNTLPKMLHKYFNTASATSADPPGHLTPTETAKIPAGFFHGIKVYPPLGFDPWPDDGSGKPTEESWKVRFLYNFCQTRGIPITTHCSDGGWIVSDTENARLWTSPARWAPVLERYDRLTVNFAHFGAQARSGKDEWRKQILDLMCRFENVYADLSFIGCRKGAYEDLASCITRFCSGFPDGAKRRERILSRILFGTDFLIHLIRAESYARYLKMFRDLDGGKSGGGSIGGFFEKRILFMTENPERFLSRRP
ncbi:MAG: amidohydrolase [Candidatus Aminicenantes bacterium]|nr:amidohydrolase [Candidatus Aminicenantes bacterium]